MINKDILKGIVIGFAVMLAWDKWGKKPCPCKKDSPLLDSVAVIDGKVDYNDLPRTKPMQISPLEELKYRHVECWKAVQKIMKAKGEFSDEFALMEMNKCIKA